MNLYHRVPLPVVGGHLPDDSVPGDDTVPSVLARQGRRVRDGGRGEIGRGGRGGGGGREDVDRLDHD